MTYHLAVNILHRYVIVSYFIAIDKILFVLKFLHTMYQDTYFWLVLMLRIIECYTSYQGFHDFFKVDLDFYYNYNYSYYRILFVLNFLHFIYQVTYFWLILIFSLICNRLTQFITIDRILLALNFLYSMTPGRVKSTRPVFQKPQNSEK